MEPRTLGQVVAEALAAKKTAGRRSRYVDNLGVVWRAFTRGRESMPVSGIQSRDVEGWLSDRPIALSTRASQLSRLSTLFEFASRRGYVRANPCDQIEVPSMEHRPPVILTVDQCRTVMETVRRDHPRALAWFALALFAGIRPEECDRLTWPDVDLDAGTVRVDAAASKVRQRRIVHLMSVAVAWLRVARPVSDLPMPHASRRRVLRSVRDALGMHRWPADALRHTAASMMLTLRQDAAAVAMELGNSPGVLFRHYREIVRREDAERWAATLP
jgi:integrase